MAESQLNQSVQEFRVVNGRCEFNQIYKKTTGSM